MISIFKKNQDYYFVVMAIRIKSESKYGIQQTTPAFTFDRRGKSQTLWRCNLAKSKQNSIEMTMLILTSSVNTLLSCL